MYVVINTLYDDITPLAIDIDLAVGLTFIADRGFPASRFVFIAKKSKKKAHILKDFAWKALELIGKI